MIRRLVSSFRASLSERRPVSLVLRALAVVAVLVALTEPSVARNDRATHTVYLIDRSESIAPQALAEAARFVAMSIDATAAPDTARAYAIAEGTIPLTRAALDSIVEGRWTPPPGAQASNLAGEIVRAVALLPPVGDRRLVLLSDGLATDGDLVAAAREVRAAGVRLSTQPPPGVESRPDARISRVDAPVTVTPGSVVEIAIGIESSSATLARLTIYQGEDLVSSDPFELAAGVTTRRYAVRAPGSGTSWIRIQLQAADDDVPENNSAETLLVVDEPGTVLWVAPESATERPGARALEAQGWPVRRIRARELPSQLESLAALSVVALDNIPADALSPAQMETIERWVRATGGGLLFVGGAQSLADGRYRQSAVEAALPVTFDVASPVQIPSLVMLFLVDTSGSMEAGPLAVVSKLQIVQEAVLASVEVMQPNQRVGVIGFNAEADWVVPILPTLERETILREITTIDGGGGTDLHLALERAFEELSEVEAGVRHVVVLSDGLTQEADFRSLARRMREAGITVSTVGIGADSDIELLTLIATNGGGRSYQSSSLTEVPRIFAAEAELVSRAVVFDEPFVPVPRTAGAEIGITPLEFPIIDAMALTYPRSETIALVDGPAGVPLLAGYRYGLGRSVILATSIGDAWGEQLAAWNQLPLLLGQLAGWLAPAQAGVRVRAVRASEGAVRVEAIGTPALLPPDRLVRATVSRPDGTVATAVLAPEAPGRFAGTVVGVGAGPAVVAVTVGTDGATDLRAVTIAPYLYPDEFRSVIPDRTALERAAEAGEGVVIATDAERMRDDVLPPLASAEGVRRGVRPLLLVVALALLLADVATTILGRALHAARRE